jgi:hypothetical protein
MKGMKKGLILHFLHFLHGERLNPRGSLADHLGRG